MPIMMYYTEFYLILGLTTFIVSLMTEFNNFVSLSIKQMVSILILDLVIWPYIVVDECLFILKEEKKNKLEKLNNK